MKNLNLIITYAWGAEACDGIFGKAAEVVVGDCSTGKTAAGHEEGQVGAAVCGHSPGKTAADHGEGQACGRSTGRAGVRDALVDGWKAREALRDSAG